MNDLERVNRFAEQANEAHAGVLAHLRKAVYYAKEAGDSLRSVKQGVGHGNWLKWLEKNFEASAETARVYMRISEYWDTHILPVMQEDEGLTLAQAREIIRRPDGEIENGTMPHLQSHADAARSNLASCFEKWLLDMPEEGVLTLHLHWTEIMLVIEKKVWVEIHKYVVLDEPPTPRRFQ